jgi:DNA-binding response OmpR family regulator
MITGSMTIRAPEQVDDAASRSAQSRLDEEIGAGEQPRLQTVLLIEDDHELAHALALRLQGTGLAVARAHDGPSGLEKLRLLQPDLIILDLRLPRMEGDRFLRFLRMTPEHSAVPVIVITGASDAALIERVENWGISRLMRKPVSPKELLRAALDILQAS